MADYHAVLKRAIDALPENTGAARRAVYQRARSAIVNQLKSYDPPLSPSDITTEQLRLEEAIRKVEADAARASLGLGPTTRPAPPPPTPPKAPATADAEAPAAKAQDQAAPQAGTPDKGAPNKAAPDKGAAATPEPAAGGARPTPTPASTPASTPAPTPAPANPGVAGPAAPDRSAEKTPQQGAPVGANEPPRAPEPRPAVVAAGPIAAAQPPKAGAVAPGSDAPAVRGPVAGVAPAAAAVAASAPALGNAGADDAAIKTPAKGDAEPPVASRDAVADIEAMTRGPSGPMAPPYSGEELRPSRLPTIAAIVAALVVFVGLLTLAYTQRDAILALMDTGGPVEVARTSDPAPQPAAPAADDNGKNSARLLNDDGSPAAPDARAVTTTRVVPPADESGVTIAPQDEGETSAGEPETAAADAETPARVVTETPSETSETQSAAVQPPAAATVPSESAVSPVAQRSILYEEGAEGESGGSAEQGRVVWSTAAETGEGGATVTVIKANVTIPGRDVSVDLTIRPNSDATLPASHLIEMQFNLPENFSGQGVSSVPGLIMKTTEEARGDALIGASVRVADGFFWIALSSIEAERIRNQTLLRDRGWIDIPILYESGKRAILTLEKGTPGERAVQLALDSWTNG